MKFSLVFSFLFLSILLPAQNYAADEINFLLSLNSKAVIRSESTEVTLLAKNKLAVKEHFVVTIFEKSADFLATMNLYYDDFVKIQDYSANVYDANGNLIKKLKKKDFMDMSAVDGVTMYSDTRHIVSDFVPTSYPYTFEYSFEYTTENTLFFPVWHPIKEENIAVEKSEYKLINNTDIQIIKEGEFPRIL